MLHIRRRLALDKLRKKLKFFPVVAVQGARQTGKSFLVRELLKQHFPLLKYVSFDLPSTKQVAIRQPHTFLLENSKGQSPLAIDEAQKVPDIFDAIKFEVDRERIPGRFLLLGSTEFSHFSKVRESSTGRLGRIRLYTLNLRETLGVEKEGLEFNRKHIIEYLSNGGMPGLFYIRNHEEQDSLIQDLLDLICNRDIHQFKSLKLDSDLCFEILKLSATLKEPSKSEISKALKIDSRKIETHLKALCELFVVQNLNPHPSGGGKPIYCLM